MNEHIESQEDKLKKRLEQRSRSKKREIWMIRYVILYETDLIDELL